MLLDWLGYGLVALAVLGCAIVVAIIFILLYLMGQHLALRRAGLACEEQQLARPLPSHDALPHIVIQIPVFNEGALVERAIAAAVQLDWPSDKLHVQICDDSTDGTSELALAAARRAVAASFDVVVIHRPERSEYKAGALKNAMAKTEHDYFAIFDVDFVPPPDFLRRCMTVLLADPTLGFVQARMEFLNADENALTRAQALVLDFHYGFEQATRSWANHLLPFNGSCGIWRRAAIEDAGGWAGDTLLEDWDLSYRAWIRGWRGTFLNTVTAPGELPVALGAWMSQQRRWASGGGEVALKMFPTFRDIHDLSRRDYWNALIPLGTWLAYAIVSATFIVAVAAILLRPSSALILGLTVYAVYASITVAVFAIMVVANRTVRRNTPLTRIILDFPLVACLTFYIAWANLRALPGTLLGRRRIFVRTPKWGSTADRGP